MLSNIVISELKEKYSYILEDEILDLICDNGRLISYSADDVMVDYNQELDKIIFLIDGTARVSRCDTKSGSEILLYYIESGESCAMSLFEIGSQITKSKLKISADTDTTIVAINKSITDDWFVKYKSWLKFVFYTYQVRFDEMLSTIDSIAFKNMEQRLMEYLKDKTKINHTDIINIKHTDIARDFHTSRVVISRLLKNLENNRLVDLYRNKIKVLEF